MDWKKILKLDGFKVFIIVILLFFPLVSTYWVMSGESSDVVINFSEDAIRLGLPFSYINLWYQYEYSITVPATNGVAPRYIGSSINFVIDIIIAYLIGVLITLIYYKIKKKSLLTKQLSN